MAEETVYIPNFAYPFKNIKEEKDCYDKLGSSIKGNYLFSAQGLWHGGVHFGSSFNKEIRAIADGELVAYRLSKKYLQNEDDKNAVEEVEKNKGFYSTGFFLLKHTIAYPKTNKLTFFSLYMHTAKKDEYVLDTHKVKGTDRFLRKGVSYADEDKLEELAVDTKITINASQTEEEKTKKRYKVLYVGDTKRTDNATIHKSNIEALDAVLKIKTINKDTPANESVQFPTTSIKIQAGEVIGLKGVYSPATQNKDEVTHIEVFSGDDIQAFADTAKQTYATDTSEDRPIPTKITVPKDTTLYELKEQQIVNSSDGTATIKAYTTSGIVTTCNGSPTCNALVNKTEIEVDTSAVVCTYRHKITKIEDQEITDDWSIYKNSIGKTDVPRKKTTEPKKQAEEKTFKLKGLKRRLYKDKVYLYIDDTTLVLYDDCKEQHPITFEWAGIIKNKSQDKFSIFEDITPMFSKEGELQMSSMYSELFREMDKLVDNPNEKLEPQEISTAAGNLKVKKLTSRMIVQHSSEWDSDIHMADAILKIMKEHKDKLKNYEDLKKHYENEKIRIENLEFFSKCQTENVTGFPTSDVVYHLNPIGLVERFGRNQLMFPFDHIPTESYKESPRKFGSNRSGGRKHAGCDLYASVGTKIYAMADGKIIDYSLFYLGTWQITVDHGDYIIRYGEVKPNGDGLASGLSIGSKVKQGQHIGYVGHLVFSSGNSMSMLHLEMYDKSATGNLTNTNNLPYKRRSDLVNPTSILDQASKNLSGS